MKVWVNGERVAYDNLSVRFPRDIGVSYCSSIYWNGVNGFEPNTWRMIRYFLTRSNAFIDIGSNIGLYSVLAKTLYPDMNVTSYEPIPTIADKNKVFHKVNNLGTGHIVNAAIGDVDGEVEIYLPAVNESLEEETTATLRKDSWQYSKDHSTFRVSSITLDSALSRFAMSDKVLIKIDVEDFESAVFISGARRLPELRPVIVCEILPRDHGNQEAIHTLHSYGYVAFALANDGLIRFTAQDFIGPRRVRDFLLLHTSVAPSLNYIDYRNLDIIQW